MVFSSDRYSSMPSTLPHTASPPRASNPIPFPISQVHLQADKSHLLDLNRIDPSQGVLLPSAGQRMADNAPAFKARCHPRNAHFTMIVVTKPALVRLS